MGGWGVRRAGSFSGKDAAAVVTDDSPYRARTPDSNVYRHHASDELMNYRDRTLDNDTYGRVVIL